MGQFLTSTRQDLVALQSLWTHADAVPHVVATVPPQHMYGMELSVLLPMVTTLAVHAGRPFFPDDVARALADIPAPRVLVTTPVHLRALVESGVALPPLAGIVSATAPLAPEIAAAAEARFGGEVREMFGSTETCVFAVRRTALEAAWTPLPGVRLETQAAGTLVHAPHLATPVLLADMMDVADDGRFQVRGRQADLLEIAGKRASLADLTRRLLAIPGVIDGTIVQLAPDPGQAVGRIAALVVAPPSTKPRCWPHCASAWTRCSCRAACANSPPCRATKPASCRAMWCWDCSTAERDLPRAPSSGAASVRISLAMDGCRHNAKNVPASAFAAGLRALLPPGSSGHCDRRSVLPQYSPPPAVCGCVGATALQRFLAQSPDRRA